MKIGIVCADLGIDPGGDTGSSVHLRSLARGLGGRGHQVELLAAAGSAFESGSNVRVTVIDSDPTLQRLRRRALRSGAGREASEMTQLLAAGTWARAIDARLAGCDAIYERQSLWSLAGLLHARRRGIPFVLEVNAPLVAQQLRYRELAMTGAADAVESELLASADRVLVTCRDLVAYVRRHGGSARRTTVVPCGVDAAWLDNAPKASDGGDSFVLGFIGSLKPWHGLDIVVRALRKLRAKDERYRLVIVGDGPERPETQAALERHGLTSAVEFVGPVPHRSIPTLLSTFDAGVAAYPPADGFFFSPLKVWEYAACSVPILASASGELPILFPHKDAALLHPPGSASKLARHAELLAHHPDLSARLRRRARAIARRHTWDRIAARVASILEHAAATPRGDV